MAKLPFRIPFRKEDDEGEPEGSPAKRNRKLITQLVFRIVFLFMFVVAVIYGGISLLLGSSLFIPRSAEGVLKSVEMPSFYAWTAESVREVNLTGVPERQDAVRSATVDTDLNKFQLQPIGVLPGRTIYVSDGNYAVRLTEAAQAEADDSGELGQAPYELVTDHCKRTASTDDDAPIPVTTVTMPSAEQLLAANPSIETDEGTIFNERAWIIDFDLTPEIIRQLMWLDFFDRALQATPDERPWVISEAELAAIDAGDYAVDYAKAWITRDKPRMIAQIDTTFTIGADDDSVPDSKYRFLAQLVPGVTAETTGGLERIELGEGCGSAASFAAGGSAPSEGPVPAAPGAAQPASSTR